MTSKIAIASLVLAASGAVQAEVIADFNAVAARTATPPPGAVYPAVTPEERRTVSFVDLATVHLAVPRRTTCRGGAVGGFVPAAAGNPVWHFLPCMRTFTLASPAQFRAEGPPPLDSVAYAEAFDEVKETGRSGGAALSPEQQEAARFHTENPNLFWARVTRVHEPGQRARERAPRGHVAGVDRGRDLRVLRLQVFP